MVPYTPGTGGDILARVFGPKLAERWKVPVVTDNRAGASGNIGTDFVAEGRGRRLHAPLHRDLLRHQSGGQSQPAVRSGEEFRARDPARAQLGLGRSSRPACPSKSMREFIDLRAQRAGKLNYSSPGSGRAAASRDGAAQARRASSTWSMSRTRDPEARWPISSAGTCRR